MTFITVSSAGLNDNTNLIHTLFLYLCESGTAYPDIEMLPKLAAALHTTVEGLLGYNGVVTDYDRRYDMVDYYWGLAPNRICYDIMKMLPFEFVVRGYMFGSLWRAYQKGECSFEKDYKLAQRLEKPVLTPAVKRDVGHDEYVSMEAIAVQLGDKMTRSIVDACFQLYHVCREYAYSKGMIIADAKFEFGLNAQGELVLADEIFTPDSSRYWNAASYEVGVSPQSFDKQLLRDWLLQNQINGAFAFDKIPENILRRTGELYRECLCRLIS